jgi:hypothetical protein
MYPNQIKTSQKSSAKNNSKRAAIEPVIGHLKQDYRLSRNYLKGINGDNMNVILAAAAMNFKHHEPLAYRGNKMLVTYLQLYCKCLLELYCQKSKIDFLRVD